MAFQKSCRSLGNKNLILSSLFFVLSLGHLTLGQFDPICPSAESISPCTCDISASNNLTLHCSGQWETGDSSMVNNLFDQVRAANNISSNVRGDAAPRLFVEEFQLSKNGFTSLDLSAFINVDFDEIFIVDQSSMATIVGATNSSEEVDIAPYRFSVQTLTFKGHVLNDAGYVEFLKFVQPQSPHYLACAGGGYWGGIGGNVSLQGLFSEFTELTHFALEGHDWPILEGGHFKSLHRLNEFFIFETNMTTLGQDALLFDPPEADMVNVFLLLSLDTNLLTDEGVHAQSGLTTIGRPTMVSFEYNLFESLSAEKFEPFLQADDRNHLFFGGNQFVCDERMKWLKDKRDEYETRVHNVDCTNDPGQDVFTTELIP